MNNEIRFVPYVRCGIICHNLSIVILCRTHINYSCLLYFQGFSFPSGTSFLSLIICLTSLSSNNGQLFPSLTDQNSQHYSSPHQIRAADWHSFQLSNTAPLHIFNSAATGKPCQETSTITSRISP